MPHTHPFNVAGIIAIQTIESKLRQLEKAEFPIEVTESGMVMDVRLLQL